MSGMPRKATVTSMWAVSAFTLPWLTAPFLQELRAVSCGGEAASSLFLHRIHGTGQEALV